MAKFVAIPSADPAKHHVCRVYVHRKHHSKKHRTAAAKAKMKARLKARVKAKVKGHRHVGAAKVSARHHRVRHLHKGRSKHCGKHH